MHAQPDEVFESNKARLHQTMAIIEESLSQLTASPAAPDIPLNTSWRRFVELLQVGPECWLKMPEWKAPAPFTLAATRAQDLNDAANEIT